MLLKALLTALILGATSFLVPKLPLGILRFILCSVGWLVQNRSRSRREQIVSQVRAEEEEFQSKCARSPAQTETVEEDWEKVDSSSSSCLTPGSDKIPGDGNDDWDGIIGFFHPFWYVRPLLTWNPRSLIVVVMQEAAASGFSGKPYGLCSSGGRKLYAPYTRETMT